MTTYMQKELKLMYVYGVRISHDVNFSKGVGWVGVDRGSESFDRFH
jgi:hypothetical protein